MNYKFALSLFTIGLSSGIASSPVEGRWDAVLQTKQAAVPFRLDISGEGNNLKGTLYNGEETESTTKASFTGDLLVLSLGHYLTTITATCQDGKLIGYVAKRGDKTPEGTPFFATRHVQTERQTSGVPQISGVWEIPLEQASPKGEHAWRFIVKQDGADASASILRVDGDSGAFSGVWHDGKFELSHFDGSRLGLLTVTPVSDGTLHLLENTASGPRTLTAYRAEAARAKGFPEPADFVAHSTMRNPDKVFTYRFPDVNGKIFSNEDPKFKGKVVLAVVTGTWCPNCHDEAQYLVQLYAKYKDQGLEIVALDFEEPEQQEELARVRAFVKQYGVKYTYLIAGTPAEVGEKVPQVVNLNTWPATLMIDRDGRVAKIHAGFASAATGQFNKQLQAEFTSTIEQLLKRPPAEPVNSASIR